MPLGIALLTDLDRAVAEDLDEVDVSDQLPYLVAVRLKGRDERRQHDYSCLDKKLSHLADTADVLGPVFRGKSEVRAESVPSRTRVRQPIWNNFSSTQ